MKEVNSNYFSNYFSSIEENFYNTFINYLNDKDDFLNFSHFCLHNSDKIYYYYDEKSNIVFWFGNFEKITGYSASFFSKLSVDDYLQLVHPNDKTALLELRQEARKNYTNYTAEYNLQHANGHYISIIDKGKYLKKATDHNIMIGCIADNTSLRQAYDLIDFKNRTHHLLDDIFKLSYYSDSVDELIIKAIKKIVDTTQWAIGHVSIFYQIDHGLKLPPCLIYSPHPERYKVLIKSIEKDGISLLSDYHIEVLKSKKFLWVKDIDKVKNYKYYEKLNLCQLKHLMICPLIIEEKVIGLMEFYAHCIEQVDDMLTELLEQIGKQMGIIVELKARKEEQKKLQMAIEQNFAAIMITDANGIIEYINPAFVKTSGYSAEELLGKKPNILKSNIHDEVFYRQLWQTISKGSRWQGEICNKRKDGSLLWEELNISPIINSKGKIVNYVAVKIDVTKKRQSEEELRRAKEEAEAASKAKSEFLANMSHEIRTPMNAIMGFTEVILQKINDEQIRNYLESIKNSGKNLLTLINDVLDLSKIEAGKLKISRDFIDPFMVFKDIEYLFSLRAQEKGLEFKVITDLNLPIGIEIDEVRLRQILINLIGNAIKFTEKGRVIVKITSFPISQEFINLKIEVEDTGIGIDASFQKTIFEPFTQLENAAIKRFGGTGLGLSITKRLVDLLGGEIFLESELNKGSKFTVVLKQIRCTANKQISTEMIVINTRNIKFYPALILIADDVENNRKYLKTVIEEIGLEIIESDNGIQTYELARKRRPQLIITDLKMPDVNGFELLNKIRSDSLTRKIPVIATTATASIEENDKLKVHKFDGILIKPIQINDIYLELMRFLPHEILDNDKKSDTFSDIVITAKTDGDIRTVTAILENELYVLWKSFEEQQPLNEVEDFAYKLRDLGKKYELDILISYGNRLITAVNNFDIDMILKILADYPKLLSTFNVISED